MKDVPKTISCFQSHVVFKKNIISFILFAHSWNFFAGLEELFRGPTSYEAFFMDVVGIPWVIPQERPSRGLVGLQVWQCKLVRKRSMTWFYKQTNPLGVFLTHWSDACHSWYKKVYLKFVLNLILKAEMRPCILLQYA